MNKIVIDYIDFWIDDRGNRWDTSSFSESEAKEMSKSLISCYNCYKCENCISCEECKELQDRLGVRDPDKFYQDLYFNN